MGDLADGQCYAGFKGGGLMLPNQVGLPISGQPLVTLARAAESDWLSMELDEVFFGEAGAASSQAQQTVSLVPPTARRDAR